MKCKNIWRGMKVMTGVIRSAAALFVITSVTDILHGVSWGGMKLCAGNDGEKNGRRFVFRYP